MAGETSLTRVYNDVMSLTRDKLAPLMADSVSNRIPTLVLLNAAGRKEKWSGGEKLSFEVFKEETVTEGYSDLDTVQTTRPNSVTRAFYEWKQVQTPVTISGREMLKNAGDAQIVNLVKARIEAGIISQANRLGGRVLGIFSDATESDLTRVTGFQSLISNTPTAGTVGNIARSNSWWQNQRDAVTTNFTTDGLISMRTLWFLCSFGSDVPDIIAFNRSTFENYERALQATLSYNLPGTAPQAALDLGLPNAMNYKGAMMVYDDGVPDNRGYYINSKYLHYVVHESRDSELGEFATTIDQDGIFGHIWWAGELCFDAMRYHGLLADGDTFS